MNKLAMQQKIERNIGAAQTKIGYLTEYVEALQGQYESLSHGPEGESIQLSNDPYLDAVADHFNEVQLMTFVQFMQAVESGRIVMHFTVKENVVYPLVRRNSI